jgi:CheY-like chemotaxis protein
MVSNCLKPGTSGLHHRTVKVERQVARLLSYGDFDMAPKDLVLCVDDEPTVLRAFPMMLRRTAYRVAVAEDGAAGLALFLQRRDEVCLVLADIVMPGMSGIEMAERILQLEPHPKILLMSAYGDRLIGRRVRRSGLPFIRKPFTYAALIEKIRSLVGVPDVAASTT